MFKNPAAFCQRFLLQIFKSLENSDKDFAALWPDESITDFDLLGFHLDKLCKDRKIVLLIDEVDRTSDNQVFLHFLGMLRSKYLARENGYSCTFHSVILAGVYDVRNIKLKLINEGGLGNIGRVYNSPWNIAANFDVDMSFSPVEIAGMLSEYENDHRTGMDITGISEEIHKFTSGYPFLVSWICKCVDEKLDKAWTVSGVQNAIKALLQEHNTLFDDLFKNLENYKNMYDFLYSILIVGESKSFMSYDTDVMIASMFGYIKCNADNRNAIISNKIFEILISDYFVSRDAIASRIKTGTISVLHQDVISDGVFDMELCLRKFAEHYKEIFAYADAPFLERHGRLLFISYLRPLINGQGFTTLKVSSQTSDAWILSLILGAISSLLS